MMTMLAVRGDVTKRRDKLARQLEQLEDRAAKVAEQHKTATEAWQSALEAGNDTTRHATNRRELSTALTDLDAEAGQVRGWLADVEQQIAAAEELARKKRVFAEESQRYAEDAARLAEVRMDNAAWRATAAEVLAIARRVTDRTGEAVRLNEELPGRAEMLRQLAAEVGADWAPRAVGPSPAEPEMSLPLARASIGAAHGDLERTARELGEAAALEISI